MEQYQAQVVSALRSSLGARQPPMGGLPGLPAPASGGSAAAGAALAAGSAAVAAGAVQHPLLQIAGGVLATCFLDSGLAAGKARARPVAGGRRGAVPGSAWVCKTCRRALAAQCLGTVPRWREAIHLRWLRLRAVLRGRCQRTFTRVSACASVPHEGGFD
jgi:hypothetical protein